MENTLPNETAPYEQVTAALRASEKAILATCMRSLARNSNFTMCNMYGWGIARRALALSSGYRLLAAQSNSIGALPMVRMQLDNTLRLYAAFFAPQPTAFCQAVFNGVQIDKIKSDSGALMKDRYLLNRVATKNPWMLDVYKLTSGYIHFSNRHIKEVFRNVADNGECEIVIGPSDEGREEKDFHEPSRCLCHLNLIIDHALDDWFGRMCGGKTAIQLDQQ